jgi:hypothetical protein
MSAARKQNNGLKIEIAPWWRFKPFELVEHRVDGTSAVVARGWSQSKLEDTAMKMLRSQEAQA